MRSLLRPILIGLTAISGVAIGSCSGNGPSLPSLPELIGTVSEAPIVGPPTEVYERIARGALACWFGASGPLKTGFMYHAEADPPGKGGKAEITIHERNRLSDNPKGAAVYKIAITPDNERTTLIFENLKLPEPMALAMEADARRWGAGGFGCADAQSGGWSENRGDNAAAPAIPKEGKKKHTPKGD